jgi:hypothetical protein
MRRTPPDTVEEMKGMMEMDPGLRRDDVPSRDDGMDPGLRRDDGMDPGLRRDDEDERPINKRHMAY